MRCTIAATALCLSGVWEASAASLCAATTSVSKSRASCSLYLELGQGNKESLANAKGRHAIGSIETGMFCHGDPFDSNVTRQRNIRALIHISEAG
jgi:hypothetical protein